MHRGACPRLHSSACCCYQSQLPLHLRLPLLSSIVCVCIPIKIRFALVGVRLQRRPIVTMNDDTARAGGGPLRMLCIFCRFT